MCMILRNLTDILRLPKIVLLFRKKSINERVNMKYDVLVVEEKISLILHCTQQFSYRCDLLRYLREYINQELRKRKKKISPFSLKVVILMYLVEK